MKRRTAYIGFRWDVTSRMRFVSLDSHPKIDPFLGFEYERMESRGRLKGRELVVVRWKHLERCMFRPLISVCVFFSFSV